MSKFIPKKSPNEITKSSIFYGWFTLAGAILVTFIVGGAFINPFGVFLPVLSEQFGWSRAEVSMALSLGIAAFGLPSMLFSMAVNKFGARFTIIVGNLLTAAGLGSLYFINELWQLYLIYIFTGAVAGFGGYISCTTLANNWFVGKRALAMSLITAAAGAGGLFFPPFTTALIKAFEWRAAWLALAAMVAVFTLISGLLIRNRPEDKGQIPEGYSSSSIRGREEPASLKNNSANWKLSEIFKVPATYLILGFVIANAFAMGTINTHQIAYVQDMGFSAMTAATTMSAFSILVLIGSLSFGTLALKINMRYLASAGLICELIGVIIMLSTKNLVLIYVYAAFIGLGTGALFAAMPTFLSAYYPRERFTQVTGLFLPFHVIAQAVMAWTAGKMYDVTGNYTLAFSLIGICVLGGSICAFFARQPKTAH